MPQFGKRRWHYDQTLASLERKICRALHREGVKSRGSIKEDRKAAQCGFYSNTLYR
jgi:hypothetical protein